METKGEVRISPRYSRDDYHMLNLAIMSDDLVWERAVDIFIDRIQGRYLNQIDSLSCDINANGFAIMALNCLLVEALYQFENGLEKTEKGNKAAYAKFLKRLDPVSFCDVALAEEFYTNIRCGILHSAQTKAESRLSDRDDFVVTVDNNILLVSVKGVSRIVKHHVHDYANRLRDSAEVELREKFIKKMTFVCRK